MTTDNIRINRLERIASTILAISMLLTIVWFTASVAYAQATPSRPKAPSTATITPASPTPATVKPSTPTPATATPAPSAPPALTVYKPTESEAKDLRIAQLEAIAARQSWDAEALRLPEYQAWQDATKRLASYQSAVDGMNRLGMACQKVRDSNKWPGDVKCNPDTNPVAFTGPGTGTGTTK